MCEEKEYIGVTVDIIISVEEFTFMIFIKKIILNILII